MSQTILFIIPAAKGHLHASFGLARILQKSGHNILFALPLIFQKYVIQQGFECVLIDSLPFAGNGEKRTDQFRGEYRVRYLDSLIDRFYNRLYKLRTKEIEIILGQVKPDIILLDSFQSSDFVILYPLLKQYKIKFAFIQTMLSLRQQPMSLPLNSNIVPNMRTNFNKIWNNYYIFEFIKSIKENILYLGRSNTRIIESAFIKQQISKVYSINKRQVFRVGFNNIPEFISSPQELEFTNTKEHYQIYLGSIIDYQRENLLNAEFNLFLNQLSDDQKIIYCSLGTVYSISNKYRRIILHFSAIIDVARILSNHLFVISISKEYSQNLVNVPKNVHFFEDVPQLLILSKASVFITHGGCNSIKESIKYHVPMLVYPISWDQPGLAARVEYYGFGLTGKLGSDSPKKILEKIKILTKDKTFRQRIMDFDSRIECTYTEDSILEKFEDTFINQVII